MGRSADEAMDQGGNAVIHATAAAIHTRPDAPKEGNAVGLALPSCVVVAAARPGWAFPSRVIDLDLAGARQEWAKGHESLGKPSLLESSQHATCGDSKGRPVAMRGTTKTSQPDARDGLVPCEEENKKGAGVLVVESERLRNFMPQGGIHQWQPQAGELSSLQWFVRGGGDGGGKWRGHDGGLLLSKILPSSQRQSSSAQWTTTTQEEEERKCAQPMPCRKRNRPNLVFAASDEDWIEKDGAWWDGGCLPGGLGGRMGVIQAQIFVFMGVLGYETNAAM
ncbi:hypothetical protein CKAH01_03785 [Colletotrichum kahawae]|uniref:Uncharacterized protein n=1 Tax=Colletotrichum kahawae TaxID=34407 RepID=A0AAE0DAW4_COLKA|nr:hypothetical protein CKAH01_03785 [Colletotrichum kahawae]